MPFFLNLKSTVLWFSVCLVACGQQTSIKPKSQNPNPKEVLAEIVVGANRTASYIPLVKGKSVGVVANQTSVIFKENGYTHLVDSLLNLGITIEKVFAPEHGFRGQADAGEMVKDGKDARTGLPIISLYGKNKKPTRAQLEGVDIVLFDIQDVGVRFYTYIATLQLVMEACVEAQIPVLVLDRPNPNGHYVDGPTMEKAHTSFLGLTTIPLVYGMTIGEYATMLNKEGWLTDSLQASLTVIPLKNYTHRSIYDLPIRPSPNLPNATAISLYPSLGLFEGTDVNAGRGTEFQFQRYGASFLDSTVYDFRYVPQPNFGAKSPKEQGETCYGSDLSETPRMHTLSLQWLLDAYQNCTDPSRFFNTSGFTKHAGTEKLQQHIETGGTEAEIKATWQEDLTQFRKIRQRYLLYD
ncbi:MAG: DUF1343 domain-containing protein [Bacteroidota bacterium]